MPKRLNTHHMFSPLHELLVDDLAGIVFAGLDVYGLLHDSICAASERSSCAILQKSRSDSKKTKASQHRRERLVNPSCLRDNCAAEYEART